MRTLNNWFENCCSVCFKYYSCLAFGILAPENVSELTEGNKVTFKPHCSVSLWFLKVT